MVRGKVYVNGEVVNPEDAVISDALNHASIIDGVRLCKAQRFRYANNDMAAALKFAGYEHQFVTGEGSHNGKQLAILLPADTQRVMESSPATSQTSAGSLRRSLPTRPSSNSSGANSGWTAWRSGPSTASSRSSSPFANWTTPRS